MHKKTSRLQIISLLVVLSLFCMLFSYAVSAESIPAGAVSNDVSDDAVNNEWGYFTHLYDNSNGLITSEANAVAQIGIGFIWIGGYSGLTRYDGNEFTHFDSTTGIASVNCLYVDSKYRLWL